MNKTEFHFYTISDWKEEEEYLRRMHNQGWKLVKVIPPVVYMFESVEPEDVIYRLDFKNNEVSMDYEQMLADYGWEHFADCAGWMYLRKPASNGEEEDLFSDNASRVEMLDRILKRRMLPLLVIFLCCVIPQLIRGIEEGIGAVTVFFGIMFVLYVYIFIHCGFKLKSMRKELK